MNFKNEATKAIYEWFASEPENVREALVRVCDGGYEWNSDANIVDKLSIGLQDYARSEFQSEQIEQEDNPRGVASLELTLLAVDGINWNAVADALMADYLNASISTEAATA